MTNILTYAAPDRFSPVARRACRELLLLAALWFPLTIIVLVDGLSAGTQLATLKAALTILFFFLPLSTAIPVLHRHRPALHLARITLLLNSVMILPLPIFVLNVLTPSLPLPLFALLLVIALIPVAILIFFLHLLLLLNQLLGTPSQ